MSDTRIEWTDRVWNPVRGCSRVSSGCDNCYAMRQARRFDHPDGPYEGLTRIGPRGVDWSGRVRLVPEQLDAPLRWRKPCRIFVNSMSDLFHESLTDEQIDRVFAVMMLADRHTFQILTKRPGRFSSYFRDGRPQKWADAVNAVCWEYGIRFTGIGGAAAIMEGLRGGWRKMPSHVWLGVSVEDQETADERIPLLLQTPAAVRFVSYEPALGPVDFRHLQPGDPPTEIDALSGTHGVLRPHRGTSPKIDWLIVGGESGPGARPCDVAWIRSAVRQCREAGIACFVKQMGAHVQWDGCGLIADNFPNQTLSIREDYTERGMFRVPLKDRKGGAPAEWPEDLRVREFPDA